MVVRTPTLFALAAIGMVVAAPALSCDGFVEAPIACDDSSSPKLAQWMLTRVKAAVAENKDKALAAFTRGENGFRTADTYVFCVGPDGVMSAHPNPILRGHDVRDLHDRTGHYFIREMVQQAKPDEVSVIRYLFPKPGSTVEEPKTTYYSRAGDQVCAVGVYDDDTIRSAATTPDGRLLALRQKLDGEIPDRARADWTAFLEALTARDEARESALGKAREGLRAVQAILIPEGRKAAPE